jgi:hypothetical protein
MITKLRLAVHKALLKLATTVFNVPPPTSSTRFLKIAGHVQLIIHTTPPPSNVTAESHVLFQDNSAPTTYVNAQSIRREPRKSGTNQETHANAHQTFHCGTENTVSLVQLEPNSIPRNINATTAQTGSKEMWQATPVFQGYDDEVYTFIIIYYAYLSCFSTIFEREPKNI